ncbi:MAG: hypothetical protein GYA51_02830 [Candidatus Methanofastidiosa archaeon]|nr:hypothetical protein [Candidatus Methanofastidiosa archaeon]
MPGIRLENNNTELHYDSYVHRGSLMVLRAGLPLSDPDMLYNYLKNSEVLQKANLKPEDFGIFHPIAEQYKGKPEEELLAAITELTIRNENIDRKFY